MDHFSANRQETSAQASSIEVDISYVLRANLKKPRSIVLFLRSVAKSLFFCLHLKQVLTKSMHIVVIINPTTM